MNLNLFYDLPLDIQDIIWNKKTEIERPYLSCIAERPQPLQHCCEACLDWGNYNDAYTLSIRRISIPDFVFDQKWDTMYLCQHCHTHTEWAEEGCGYVPT